MQRRKPRKPRRTRVVPSIPAELSAETKKKLIRFAVACHQEELDKRTVLLEDGVTEAMCWESTPAANKERGEALQDLFTIPKPSIKALVYHLHIGRLDELLGVKRNRLRRLHKVEDNYQLAKNELIGWFRSPLPPAALA